MCRQLDYDRGLIAERSNRIFCKRCISLKESCNPANISPRLQYAVIKGRNLTR